jgi:hypothetical protein
MKKDKVAFGKSLEGSRGDEVKPSTMSLVLNATFLLAHPKINLMLENADRVF